MSQGKARDKDEIINEVLQEFFKLGCSVRKACDYAGIPSTTVQTWIDNDDDLRAKITAWQNEPNLLARRQWIKSIQEGKPGKFGNDIYTPSKEWMERKEKDEFSQKTEVENTGEQTIKIVREVIDGDPNRDKVPDSEISSSSLL